MNECRKFIFDRVRPEDLKELPEPAPEDIKTMLDIALSMAAARGFVVKLSGDPEGCVGFQVGDFEVVPRETEVKPKSVWDDTSLSNSPEGCEVYALLRSDGVLVPPMDNDCTGFLAWPTYIEALDGLSYQQQVWGEGPDTRIAILLVRPIYSVSSRPTIPRTQR